MRKNDYRCRRRCTSIRFASHANDLTCSKLNNDFYNDSIYLPPEACRIYAKKLSSLVKVVDDFHKSKDVVVRRHNDYGTAPFT